MQTIYAKENNGVFSCDIGVSKDEWLEILESPSTQQEFIETLLRFYYMPEHKGSCSQVSREQGGNASTLNIHVSTFGGMVKKKLDRFEIIGTDKQLVNGLVPMNNGRSLDKNEIGTYEWTLRKELVEALREYLLRYLVKRYKELRKELPIKDDHYDELYKWELIKDCKDKDVLFIAERLTKKVNLIDATRDVSVIRYMLNNKGEVYKSILNQLINDEEPLNKRLKNFKQAMNESLPEKMNGKKIMGKANDERMASAILTCHTPQKYTFYKNDVYVKFCQYLGISDKYAGKCLDHFLELLYPLKRIVEHDLELQGIVADSLKGQEENYLLLAQDILWEILVCYPKNLGYIYPLVWRPRYWLVGFNFNDNESQFDRFVAKGIWEGHFEEEKKQITTARKIKTGDILILKSTFTRQKKIPCLKISGIGVVTGSRNDAANENGFVSVIRTANYINLDKKVFEGKSYGQYLSTVHELRAKETALIDYVNSILNMERQKKFDKYTELLRTNFNLILTGAPGTGKTYMAKEIAKEMGAEWELVQFHPSYDYTDFVEGLRPKEDENGNIGFERRDGVFKAFCAKALENYLNSKKDPSTLEQEVSTRDLLEDFIEEAYNNETVFHTSGTKNGFAIIENKERSIRIEIPDNEKAKDVLLPKSDLLTLLENKVEINGGKDIQEYFKRKYRTQKDSYVYVLYNEIRKRPTKKISKTVEQISQKPFVFIIDEINRGEISKIFGELFYSIDPGYRGINGRVNTQYQNMIEEGDAFKDGFFVPENVYIIGTMNDIDRSVESMDFAMRRRFAWEEVTAKESYEAMIAHNTEFLSLKEEIRARMSHLNEAILSDKLCLGEAYQIGGAYFMKVLKYVEKNPQTAFDMLWNNHLKGLIAEYLRGNPKAQQQLETLHEAYNNTKIEDDPINDGQPQTDTKD